MSTPGRARLSLTALLMAHTLSRTGNVVTLFAIPFLVLETGGGAIQVGIAAAATTAPVVLGAPLGGVLVDRIGYLRSSVGSDVVSGMTIALIPVLAALIGLPFPALLALVFLSGLLDTPGETARRVLLPDLFTKARIPLERSVGFLDGATRAATLIGAPLAALLVASLGAFPALLVTAGAFALSALVAGVLIRPAAPSPSTDAVADAIPGGYWVDLRDGLRFVRSDRLLRPLILLVLVTNTLNAARGGTLLPLYASQELAGPASLGVLAGSFGGAALIGSIVFGFIAHRLPRRVPFVICYTLITGSSLGPALGLDTPWLVGVFILSGLAAGAINPIIGAVELERIPPHLRARVLGLITAGAWAGMPLGGLLGGFAANSFGLTATFTAAFVIYLAVTLTPLRGGPWKLMERTDAPGNRTERESPGQDQSVL
ncbi:MFS transporter [Arthrobacter echini]|uniref:MFS transporter n=1 Tax=Arthrobacter echini TaxID=1529066 RepID=A0A4S5E2X9_9MICC|nr:MFS transporter [Arthrobacter echini]THJ65764.1 MFS transporter [Arthrobacter echini]